MGNFNSSGFARPEGEKPEGGDELAAWEEAKRSTSGNPKERFQSVYDAALNRIKSESARSQEQSRLTLSQAPQQTIRTFANPTVLETQSRRRFLQGL